MANVPVLLNGTEYSAVDTKVNINGVPVFGISAIEAKEAEEKQDLYGLGSKHPVARRRGKITTEGSISLYPVEINAIQKSVEGGKITEIAPFDISLVVVAKNSSNSKVVVLKNVEFMENAIGFDIENSGSNAVQIPLLISNILWK